jgi:hypothetical protein
MPSKRRPQARRGRKPRAGNTKSTPINIAQSRRTGKPRPIPALRLSERSQGARDRALHVLAAMRRDPDLSLAHAADLEGVKPATVKRHFSSALRKTGGKFKVRKSDRYAETLYVPDAHGSPVAVNTRSSKDRKALSRYLRDLGRYLRGNRHALAPWHGRTIAGVPLVTAGRTIVAIEPALSEFSLYRTFNGGTA